MERMSVYRPSTSDHVVSSFPLHRVHSDAILLASLLPPYALIFPNTPPRPHCFALTTTAILPSRSTTLNFRPLRCLKLTHSGIIIVNALPTNNPIPTTLTHFNVFPPPPPPPPPSSPKIVRNTRGKYPVTNDARKVAAACDSRSGNDMVFRRRRRRRLFLCPCRRLVGAFVRA